MRLQMSYDLDVAVRAWGRQIRKEITCERYAGMSMYDDELLGRGMAMPSALRPSR